MEFALSAHGAEAKQVQLGLPGAWAINSGEPSDHYTTKIGGYPDWPSSLQHALLRDEFLKCAVCGGWLGLVAQVHAPLAALIHTKQLNDRTIYIFGCPSEGCGVDPACWRTIRVQREHSKETDACQLGTEGPDSAPLENSRLCTESSSANHEPSSADWWEDENSWGGESQGGDASASPNSEDFLNLSELAASLTEAGQLAAENSHEEPPSSKSNGSGKIISRGDGGQGSIQTNVPIPKFPLPVLPCFYIYFDGESTSSSSSSVPADALQATSRNPIEESGEHSAEVWEGEEYEPDRALFVDKTYLRFKKHLDLSPNQCFRYSFGGQVLWAVEDEDDVALGKCGGCGGPRVFEMQLMSPLLYFLQEASKNDSAPMSNSLDEWDWFTLIVATCAQSCSQKADETTLLVEGKAGLSIVEEAIILQQDATRISAADLSS
ncbi:unnamed protein product [Calypogeia fissa]